MIGAEVLTLIRLARGKPRHGSQTQRLQAFYGSQARHYDAFRERLLHGRRELIERLSPSAGARVVDLGSGTGRNLLFFGEQLAELDRVDLVDLCPALLTEAHKRTAGMSNVRVINADATTYRPDGPVDCVFFSYSLTMIRDWRNAIRNALTMLRPGGVLGVVDFYVSASTPDPGLMRHGAFTRFFWPRWFAHDGVRPEPGHLRLLRESLPDHDLLERYGPVPYLPGLRTPYYLFVGRVPRSAGSAGSC